MLSNNKFSVSTHTNCLKPTKEDLELVHDANALTNDMFPEFIGTGFEHTLDGHWNPVSLFTERVVTPENLQMLRRNRKNSLLCFASSTRLYFERLLVALGIKPSQITIVGKTEDGIGNEFKRRDIALFERWKSLRKKFNLILIPNLCSYMWDQMPDFEDQLEVGRTREEFFQHKEALFKGLLLSGLKHIHKGGEVRLGTVQFGPTSDSIKEIIDSGEYGATQAVIAPDWGKFFTICRADWDTDSRLDVYTKGRLVTLGISSVNKDPWYLGRLQGANEMLINDELLVYQRSQTFGRFGEMEAVDNLCMLVYSLASPEVFQRKLLSDLPPFSPRERILDVLIRAIPGSECDGFVQMMIEEYGLDRDKHKDTIKLIRYRLIRFLRAIRALRLADFSIDEERVRELRVLDLACGSSELSELDGTQSEDQQTMYEPWLCRLLVQLGVNEIIGLDWRFPHYTKGDYNTGIGGVEPGWSFVKCDLTEPKELEDETKFPSHSMDVVHCNQFMLHENLKQDAQPLEQMRKEHLPPRKGPIICGIGMPSQNPEDYLNWRAYDLTLNNQVPQRYIEIVRRILIQVQRILVEGGIFIINDTMYRKRDGGLAFVEHLVPLSPVTLKGFLPDLDE